MEMDRKFTLEMGGSALDVDIFAQAAEGEADLEQLEELLFKLRRTPHTVNTTPSTGYAAVRALIGKGAGEEHLQHLVRMLEDPTNYGLFMDQYTALLLLDKLVEEGRRPEGARVASQLMLQVIKATGERMRPIPITTGGELGSSRSSWKCSLLALPAGQG